MDIFQLLNNQMEGLSEEEREFAESFNRKFREKLIEELVNHEIKVLLNEAKENKEVFFEKMENIFVNGNKGYKNIPTKTLIDIFIDKKNEGEFIYLIESIL